MATNCATSHQLLKHYIAARGNGRVDQRFPRNRKKWFFLGFSDDLSLPQTKKPGSWQTKSIVYKDFPGLSSIIPVVKSTSARSLPISPSIFVCKMTLSPAPSFIQRLESSNWIPPLTSPCTPKLSRNPDHRKDRWNFCHRKFHLLIYGQGLGRTACNLHFVRAELATYVLWKESPQPAALANAESIVLMFVLVGPGASQRPLFLPYP